MGTLDQAIEALRTSERRIAEYDRPDVPATNAVGPSDNRSAEMRATDLAQVKTADMRCEYCNAFGYHKPERCPQVRAIEYYPSGKLKRVELAR